jgi:hypothetical protein
MWVILALSAALWFYRWTETFVPPGVDYIESDWGTPVIVI